MLKDNGQLDEAIAIFREVVLLDPGNAKTHCNLGNALQKKGQLDDAIAIYQQAIALDRDSPEAHNNLGSALNEKGQFDHAIASFQQAIALRPIYAEAHSNLAHALLARGNFARGWNEYEWRWKHADFTSRRRNLPQPLWDGRPFSGARLLLHAEQGLGDTLQFIRYLPMVKQRGGEVIIDCQAGLARLLEPIAAGCTLIAQGQPLPAFDMHCPLLSLPRVFGTTLENIPREVPYLAADAGAVEKWSQRLAVYSGSLKVGLVWAGNKTHLNDRNRSIPLSAFARLPCCRMSAFTVCKKGTWQSRSPPRRWVWN